MWHTIALVQARKKTHAIEGGCGNDGNILGVARGHSDGTPDFHSETIACTLLKGLHNFVRLQSILLTKAR